ncbi:MAG TPA: VOC family protein [Verrucomicrobiae bacterium]|nr:VOC family protein [Verrucomicrobiae bacterium]
MISNRSVPTNILLAHLAYPDVSEAVTWLCKTFGFREHFRYGDPVSGAQLSLGNAFIMVHGPKPHSSSPAAVGKNTQSLTVFVEDVDAHCQRSKSTGARIIEELHVTEYGERQYGVEDFAGHHWLFSRHARDVNPTDWGAVVTHPVVLPAPTSLAPLLSVRRGLEAVEFYKTAFGAEELFCLNDGGSVVAQMRVGQSDFWLADESPEHFNFSPESIGGSTVRLVLIVEEPDAFFQRAIAAGAKEVWPVADQPYRWRMGRVVDPFGHHWEIGRPLT